MAREDYYAEFLRQLSGMQSAAGQGAAMGMSAARGEEERRTVREWEELDKQKRSASDLMLKAVGPEGERATVGQAFEAGRTGIIPEGMSDYEIGTEGRDYAPSTAEKEWSAAGGLDGTGMTLLQYVKDIYRKRTPRAPSAAIDKLKSTRAIAQGILTKGFALDNDGKRHDIASRPEAEALLLSMGLSHDEWGELLPYLSLLPESSEEYRKKYATPFKTRKYEKRNYFKKELAPKFQKLSEALRKGGVLVEDAQGNKAIRFPDGTFDVEIFK